MNKIIKKIAIAVCALTMVCSACVFAACDPAEGSSSTPGSSQTPSSSVTPGGSSVTPGSSATPGSSVDPEGPSGFTPDPNFAYKDYLKNHTEGQRVTYVFEAENTDLTSKSGPGFSGAGVGASMAKSGEEGFSGQYQGCVTYLAGPGVSVNFLIVSDRDVNDAKLVLSLGAEFIDMVLTPNNYSIRIDDVTAEDLKSYNDGGAFGRWDEMFLNFDFEANDMVDTRNTRYITEWACGEIEVEAADVAPAIVHGGDFEITTTLSLKKGVTCISLVTANNDAPGLGTLGAISPVVDCIKISTNAQLGMYKPQDNGHGTPAQAVSIIQN